MQTIKQIFVKYRYLLVLGFLVPQLVGCEMLLKLIGLGLVDNSGENLPYRVVTNSAPDSAEAKETYYYGAFKPNEAANEDGANLVPEGEE